MNKPFAITLDVGSSLANRTGSWRTVKPVYVNRLPPCNAKCPAGEKCRDWLFHAESGHYEDAWRTIIEDNPFPATMGRSKRGGPSRSPKPRAAAAFWWSAPARPVFRPPTTSRVSVTRSTSSKPRRSRAA